MIKSIGRKVWHIKHKFKGNVACLIYADELVIFTQGKYWA